MRERMTETEPAEVYVIHLLQGFRSRVTRTEMIPLRFMPCSLAAMHSWHVQSLHKMTHEESGWKLTSPKFTGGNRRGPRCFDRPALLAPRKPAGQIAVISNLDGDALNGRF